MSSKESNSMLLPSIAPNTAKAYCRLVMEPLALSFGDGITDINFGVSQATSNTLVISSWDQVLVD